MGWRTIHYCDLCGVEDVNLVTQFQSDQKCDLIELCPTCLDKIQEENHDFDCDVNDPLRYAIWDINLYCKCPECNNYINAFDKRLWDHYEMYHIFEHAELIVECDHCQTQFEVITTINLPVKRTV